MKAPASPCTGVCRISTATGWCKGCRRTLEEIADWPMSSPAEQRQILARLKQRR